MGLDQSWYRIDENGNSAEIHYHRKVPALQDFMEKVWREQGGEGDFNRAPLTITTEILDRLENVMADDQLNKEASGFFWGRHDESHIEDIREAIKGARGALAEGYKVTYDSWW